MKKISTFKTLLVGLLALGATSAWAEDTYTEVYKRAAVTEWTTKDATDWNAAGGAAIDATNGLGANANQTATYVNKSFTVLDNCKIKYEVDWTYATATGRTSNWNWIQFGSFLRIAVNSSYNMQVSTDAGATWNATVLGYYYNGTFTKKIELIFDTQKKVVESFKFDGTDRTSLVAGNFNSASFNSISTGFVRGGSVSWTLANYLTTVAVSQAEQAAAAEATYTINYTLNGSTIKSDEGTSVEGAVIDANSTITVDGTKYLITAAEAPSITLVSGANTLEVPVRLPYTATLTITKEIAGVAQEPVVINLVETDSKVCAWSYSYPMYVEKDGVYYIADETETFGEAGTFTNGQTLERTVKYTNPDNTVVYFGEPNEVAGSNFAYSNGSTGFITGGIAYANCPIIKQTLPAGEYTIESNVTGNANRNLVIGDFTDTNAFPVALVTITTTGKVNETISLTGTTSISISGKDQGNGKFNQSADIDYILIKKVIPTSVTVTISDEALYATYCSPYALDFTNVTGLAAYKATLDGSNVSFTSVSQVPANTGLLLQGAGGEYTIPVIESSPVEVESALVGVTEETVVDGAGIFVLLLGDQGVGFYKTTAESFIVSANTAYFSALTDPSRSFIPVDETTAIKAIEDKQQQDGVVYNLAGQRVAKAQKGLYIIGGKKVIK